MPLNTNENEEMLDMPASADEKEPNKIEQILETIRTAGLSDVELDDLWSKMNDEFYGGDDKLLSDTKDNEGEDASADESNAVAMTKAPKPVVKKGGLPIGKKDFTMRMPSKSKSY